MEKRIRNIILFIIVLIVFVILGILGYRRLHRGGQEEDIIVKDNVKVVTSEMETDKQIVKVEDNCIVFRENPQYNEGDVLVSGMTDLSPNGYIRKVVATKKQDGQFVVETEPAVLTEVFEKAHISRQIELTDENNSASISDKNVIDDVGENDYRIIQISNANKATKISSNDNATDYMFKSQFDEQADVVEISGETGMSIWVEVDMDIDHGDIECAIAARTKEYANTLLECRDSFSNEADKQLLKRNLPNFQFTVAGIPIVVTNELEISLGADMNLEGDLGMNYDFDSDATIGFQYSSKTGKVKEINDMNLDSDGLEWNTMSVSGSASAGPYFHLITKLYDSSGLDLSVGLTGEIEGTAEVTDNEKLDGYAGKLDLAITPKIQGEIIVDTPIIDENLLEQSLFEAELKPLWTKQWKSSANWEDDLEWTGTGKQGSTYITRLSEVEQVTCPVFQFDIPQGWYIESEELGEGNGRIYERVVLANGSGITVTYYDIGSRYGLGGGGRTWVYGNISKVADSEFEPSIPSGCGYNPDAPYTKLGKMVVAKIQAKRVLFLETNEEYDHDEVFYAVVPESYIGDGKIEFSGQIGHIDDFSFPYPNPHAFIAEGCDTAEEEKEVIKILKSFTVAE